MATTSRGGHDAGGTPAETGAADAGGAVIDEIRDLLWGDAQKAAEGRVRRLEETVRRLEGELERKLGDLEDTPWKYLSDAIAAIAYRLETLERRLRELGGG